MENLIDKLLNTGMEGCLFISNANGYFYSNATGKKYTIAEMKELSLMNPNLELTVYNIFSNKEGEPIEIEGANVVNIQKTY